MLCHNGRSASGWLYAVPGQVVTVQTFLPLVGNGPTEPQGEGEHSLTFAEQLFDLMRHDPNQKRPTLVYDRRLQEAATRHCEDMAKQNFFSHENPDGVWPNQRVRNAGYRLPVDWPGNTNFVESICAGQPTAQEAWGAWMKSPTHAKHLLGLSDFFAAQVNVGMGYYKQEGSVYLHFWCCISAPPE